jgi:MYXO-CTERM domain-containing protein
MKATLLGVTVAVASVLAVTAARPAQAMPSEVHTVYWKQDTSTQTALDDMFSCLAKSSSFGTTWATQFGVSPVEYVGSSVLTGPAPGEVMLDGNLTTILTDAFDKGLVPAPVPGAANEYVVMVPQGSIADDTMGTTMCDGSGVCAEHDTATYKGIAIDIAIVPTQCPSCGQGLDAATVSAEHEAAEGIADLGTAQYEVGDGCEDPQVNMTTLECCGKQYTLQQLAGSGGQNDCQTMDATGSKCFCADLKAECKTDKDCCSGASCKSSASADGGAASLVCCKDLGAKCTDGECCGDQVCTGGVCAAPPPPQPEPSDDDAGGGITPRGDGGGVTQPEAGGDDGGANGADGSQNPAPAGCGCKAAPSSVPGEPLLVAAGLFLVFALRRRAG